MKDVAVDENLGELTSSIDPGVSEWGNPIRVMSYYFRLKKYDG